MQFSYTKLTSFETCPYRYYLHYVCGEKEPPTEALEIGTAVHASISRFLKGEARLDLVVQEEIQKTTLLNLDKHFPEVYGMVQNFTGSFTPSLGTNLFSEVFLEKPLGQHKVIGYADLVQETPEEVIITDFKTGWKQYEADDTMQLALYAWMLRDKYPEKPIKVRLWWLRYKRSPQVEVEVDTDKAVAWAQNVISRIEDAAGWPGDMGYDRKVGAACASCPFSTQCLGVHVPEDPSELAGLALRLEASLERVKAALKDCISSAGPVEVGGEVWDLYPRASWKFDDVKGVYDFLAGVVDDPWKYFKVDAQKIAPLLKGEFADDICALGEQVTTMYLGHKPAKEKEAARQ